LIKATIYQVSTEPLFTSWQH